MLQQMLEVCACFDWLSPVIAGIQTVANRPTYTFRVPQGYGWSSLAIERLLREHGVRTWGRMIFNRTIMFTVRLSQARWAQHLLEREGIPINNPFARSVGQRQPQTLARIPTPSPIRAVAASLDRLDRILHRLR
jgi:hypothetical protein